MLLPPPLDAVAGELAGVVAGPQVHVAVVLLHVVQPVRDDHARGEAGEVVVERLDDPLRQEVPGPVEVADQLLLLGVHAHDRVVRRQVLPLEPGDVLELLVAVGMAAHRLGLLGLAGDVAVLLEQLLDHRHADRRARLGQVLGDLLIGQVGPADLLPHRVARRAILEHPQEVLLQVRDGAYAPLRPAPFLRTRSPSPSGS